MHEHAASPDVVNSRTPPELAVIAMKCLAKNAAERYQRGNQLADALIDFVAAIGAPDALRAATMSRRIGSTTTIR